MHFRSPAGHFWLLGKRSCMQNFQAIRTACNARPATRGQQRMAGGVCPIAHGRQLRVASRSQQADCVAGLRLPEGLAELPTPRPPCEIAGERVLRNDGADLTEAFARGAQRALEMALRHECRLAVVKSRSPSCGAGHIYDGSFSKRLCEGDGLWVRLLRRHAIAIMTEETFAKKTEEEIRELLSSLS